MEKIEISKCADCPLYDWDGCDCNHPGKPDITTVIYADEVLSTPNWCPLLTSPITITLNKKDDAKNI